MKKAKNLKVDWLFLEKERIRHENIIKNKIVTEEAKILADKRVNLNN